MSLSRLMFLCNVLYCSVKVCQKKDSTWGRSFQKRNSSLSLELDIYPNHVLRRPSINLTSFLNNPGRIRVSPSLWNRKTNSKNHRNVSIMSPNRRLRHSKIQLMFQSWANLSRRKVSSMRRPDKDSRSDHLSLQKSKLCWLRNINIIFIKDFR